MQQYRKNLGKVSMTPEGVWNRDKSFEKLSIVYEEITEHAYISKQDVPSGVDLNDARYWMPLNVSGYSDSNFISFADIDENGQIKTFTLEEAIKSIKDVGRKPGCIISFYNNNIDKLDLDGRWEIWQFNGINVYDWEKVENWTNIKSIVINGDIINTPDEEDITSVDGRLKLKDREAINGMGYVILRKNKTFAEQVTKANTIYEIRYDFDLNGEKITIPEGCVLDFQGGSLSNGNIIANRISIINKVKFINIEGNISESQNNAHSSWFGEYKTSSINKACKLFSKTRVVIDSGDYEYDEQITVPYDIELYAEPSTIYANKQGTIISIYSEYLPLNLKALKIFLNEGYSGTAVELRGNGYSDIRGYVSDSSLFYYGIVHRLDLYFPIIEGTLNKDTIGLSVISADRPSGAPYRFIYNKKIIASFSNIETGIFINCNNDLGSMTNNKYDLSFNNVDYGVRLSRMLSNSNIFRVVYQCDKNSKKVLLNDNFDNDIYGLRSVYFEYLEIWDPDSITDQSVVSELIDNCCAMSIGEDKIGGEAHDYLDSKRFFRLKNKDIHGWRDFHAGLTLGELKCGHATIGDFSWFRANMQMYEESTDSPNFIDCLKYFINKLNAANPTRSVEAIFSVGPHSGSATFSSYKYLILGENNDQLKSVRINFIIPGNAEGVGTSCLIRYVTYNIIDEIDGYSQRKVYQIGYNSEGVSSITELSSYETTSIIRRGGTSSARPKYTSNQATPSYLDTTVLKPIWWTGQSWIDANGFKPIKSIGKREDRPVLEYNDYGVSYYDETIKSPIWWDGLKWISSDGNNADYNKSGSTNERPIITTHSNHGYQYFDTTIGKPIWWTGTAWVDATGADV